MKKSVDELRNEFLNHVWRMIEYWEAAPQENTLEKLQGLAEGIMALLDGHEPTMPGYVVAPVATQRPLDETFARDWEGQYDLPMVEIETDISGTLRDDFWALEKTKNLMPSVSNPYTGQQRTIRLEKVGPGQIAAFFTDRPNQVAYGHDVYDAMGRLDQGYKRIFGQGVFDKD